MSTTYASESEEWDNLSDAERSDTFYHEHNTGPSETEASWTRKIYEACIRFVQNSEAETPTPEPAKIEAEGEIREDGEDIPKFVLYLVLGWLVAYACGFTLEPFSSHLITGKVPDYETPASILTRTETLQFPEKVTVTMTTTETYRFVATSTFTETFTPLPIMDTMSQPSTNLPLTSSSTSTIPTPGSSSASDDSGTINEILDRIRDIKCAEPRDITRARAQARAQAREEEELEPNKGNIAHRIPYRFRRYKTRDTRREALCDELEEKSCGLVKCHERFEGEHPTTQTSKVHDHGSASSSEFPSSLPVPVWTAPSSPPPTPSSSDASAPSATPETANTWKVDLGQRIANAFRYTREEKKARGEGKAIVEEKAIGRKGLLGRRWIGRRTERT